MHKSPSRPTKGSSLPVFGSFAGIASAGASAAAVGASVVATRIGTSAGGAGGGGHRSRNFLLLGYHGFRLFDDFGRGNDHSLL